MTLAKCARAATVVLGGFLVCGCKPLTWNFGRLTTPEMTEQRSGVTVDLRAVAAVDQDAGWASGAGGTWLRTTDGGKSWMAGTVPGAERLDFRSLAAFDAERANLLSAGSPARMFRTMDGGASWREVYRNEAPGIFFDALRFADRSRGYALADPIDGHFVLMETTDGGETWTGLPGPEARPGEGAFAASFRPGRPRRPPVVWNGRLDGARLPLHRPRPDLERVRGARTRRSALARGVLDRLHQQPARCAGGRRLPGARAAGRVRYD
jgi:photosystem II stability/assembly factor-like uncharacterized protein